MSLHKCLVLNDPQFKYKLGEQISVPLSHILRILIPTSRMKDSLFYSS